MSKKAWSIHAPEQGAWRALNTSKAHHTFHGGRFNTAHFRAFALPQATIVSSAGGTMVGIAPEAGGGWKCVPAPELQPEEDDDEEEEEEEGAQITEPDVAWDRGGVDYERVLGAAWLPLTRAENESLGVARAAMRARKRERRATSASPERALATCQAL